MHLFIISTLTYVYMLLILSIQSVQTMCIGLRSLFVDLDKHRVEGICPFMRRSKSVVFLEVQVGYEYMLNLVGV